MHTSGTCESMVKRMCGRSTFEHGVIQTEGSTEDEDKYSIELRCGQ